MCPALANPANGIVSTSDDLNVGSTATFKCNMCYTLYGDNVRVCQDDGSWSGDETTCEGK